MRSSSHAYLKSKGLQVLSHKTEYSIDKNGTSISFKDINNSDTFIHKSVLGYDVKSIRTCYQSFITPTPESITTANYQTTYGKVSYQLLNRCREMSMYHVPVSFFNNHNVYTGCFQIFNKNSALSVAKDATPPFWNARYRHAQ